MQNPSRRQVAKYLAEKLAAGESPKRIAKILAAWLTESKQTRTAELILRDIESALFHDYKFLVANVVSARKLSRESLRNLREMLLIETDAKTAEIIEQIDSKLIGGVVIRTPESEMDASSHTKLQKLRTI